MQQLQQQSCSRPRIAQQQPQQQQHLGLRPLPLRSRLQQQHLRLLAAASSGEDPPPSKEDRDKQGKADFSAYWSLKFREFFSKRRQYLELTRKRQEPPEIFTKIDEQIRVQEEKLEAARMQARRRTVEEMTQNPAMMEQAAQQDQQLMGDVARARAELQQPRLKLMALTAVQLRSLVKAVLLAPFTLPAALAARWRALFASSSYENFLMSEGEKVWAWRNRTENERWFWEVLAVDRLLIPVAWTICYQAVVPNNLIWSVLVPLCFITWQDGRVPGPGQLEWWLIMVIGLYMKCWDQICWLVSALCQWG